MDSPGIAKTSTRLRLVCMAAALNSSKSGHGVALGSTEGHHPIAEVVGRNAGRWQIP
jgi:hypothetical protein